MKENFAKMPGKFFEEELKKKYNKIMGKKHKDEHKFYAKDYENYSDGDIYEHDYPQVHKKHMSYPPSSVQPMRYRDDRLYYDIPAPKTENIPLKKQYYYLGEDRPSSYMKCSIFTCCCINIFFGIVAIWFSSKSMSAWERGSFRTAEKLGNKALLVNLIGLAVTLIFIIIGLIEYYRWT